MLFQVEMVVTRPIGIDDAVFDEIVKREKIYAQELMKEGAWRHIWRKIGQFANLSIFDVRDGEHLHEILCELPLFPFMSIKVTALCQHPSALEGAN